MTQPEDLCFDIADFVVNSRFEKLSPEAIEGAKMSIIDTFGVCLGASGREPAVRPLIDFVQESGGRPEASVVAFGGQVPAIMAAFANGALAHCLDYDDQTPWGQHSASSLIPAAFAIGESLGGVSGRQMITAVAIGQDVFNRMRRYVDWKKDWMFTTVMGVFSATAASSYLLNLSKEQAANALGIATMQCCGSAEVVNSMGSDLRAMYAGFPAKGAVLASLLAKKGLSGLPAPFEGPFGVMNLYFMGRYDRSKILDGLGEDYTGGLTLYKRWPAVGTSHSHIHATIEIMREHSLHPDDIAELTLFVGDYHQLMSEPIEKRRRPETLVDAKFSLPFLVAIAAARGDLRLADFVDAALNDAQILAVANKIVLAPDPTLDWKLELPAGRVEIVTRDGARFVRTGTHVPGSAENPMGWPEIFTKFEDCAACALTPLGSEAIARTRDIARTMETMDDATALFRLRALASK